MLVMAMVTLERLYSRIAIPSEQLVIVPIHTESLHVRYHVSCDKLQRTTTLSS